MPSADAEALALIRRSLAGEATETFVDRVAGQAAALRDAIAAGDLDNQDFAIGLEMEVYAVDEAAAPDDGPAPLARVPEAVFEAGATKELGLHNAEINTEPSRLDAEGLTTQADDMRRTLSAARRAASERDLALVLDAMWTVPPAAGSQAYLSDIETHDDVVLAANMRDDPRYSAIDNDVLRREAGTVSLSVPGADLTFPTILFESLATSIQPHLQVPEAAAFPAYYNAAIRTMAPVLALSTNSPFLPGDLYDDVSDPAGLVEATHHELRIAAFEQSVNATPHSKVRVPSDIEAPTDVVDRVVADDLYAPFLREWLTDDPREDFAEHHWEFDYKRTTYWRWLRCVIGGDPVVGSNDERSLRIEYRPIPTQPSVRDTVGMMALTAGLIRGLVATDHPITDLPWSAAEDAFYDVVERGLDADIHWLTAAGERTTDQDAIYEEVFEIARAGLDAAGVPESVAERHLAPIVARWEAGRTPSTWKKARVREALADGADLETAIAEMQATYRHHAQAHESFADWL
jgi:hypothetical protein